MEAVLLVGGQGTRLRPLTLTTPKPMLPVANHPCTAHQIAFLKAVGITRVILSTSYKAEVFEDFFGHGESLGIEIVYVTEASPLGTGGAIRNVSDSLQSAASDPVVILNGDILSSHNIAEQINFHRAHKADVTLHLREVEDPRAFGLVVTDVNNQVVSFTEKPQSEAEIVTRQINAGCYIFNRSVIDEIPAGRVVSVERETFPQLLADGRNVMGYVDNNYWLDLGTSLSYVQGSRDVVTGLCASPLVKASPALIADTAKVDAGAIVNGGSSIGDGAIIGVGARVQGSVVMAGAHIGAGVVLTESIVGAQSVVGENSVLDGVVVADLVHIPSQTHLNRGDQVFPDGTVTQTS